MPRNGCARGPWRFDGTQTAKEKPLPNLTKRQEWAQSWPMPFIAMLGIAGPAAFAYTNGIFMTEMTRDFGWTKTEFSAGMMVQMLVSLIVGPLAARALDLHGSRRVLLVGIIPFAMGLALLGQVSGAVWQWWAMSALLAVAAAGVIPAAWMNGVVQSFNSARGMAIAVCLAGIGLATVGWPLVATYLVTVIGWRLTLPTMAGIWAAIVLPLVYFFYRPVAHVKAAKAENLPPIGPSVRTPTFWILIIAGGLFSSVQFGLIVHHFPAVRLQGISMEWAASMVSIIGVFSILGRLCTGALLDLMPTKPLAIIAFLLPLPVIALLVFAEGSIPMVVIASALLGFAAGSEVDIVAYLSSRRFDPRIFGTIYTLFQMAFAVSASAGPLLGSWAFDSSGSYFMFHTAAAGMIIFASFLILFLPGSGKPSSAVDL